MLQRPDSLGYCVYLSTFPAQWETLGRRAGTGAKVFLSLHISEEFDETYCQRAKAACHTLADAGFRTIADVSPRTLTQFGAETLGGLARELELWAVRVDFGFSDGEIRALAREFPVVLNASTTASEFAADLARNGNQVWAMHNFYPRPETGLDEDLFRELNWGLREAGLEPGAFIPGDTTRRGPLFEGLPTLERHRRMLPSAAFAELAIHFGLREIFLADPGISPSEAENIDYFCKTGVLSIPARLETNWEHLYGQEFTCRVDSPQWLIRFQESRRYATQGAAVTPANCVCRSRGAITADNVRYGRYTGEIQLLRQDFPADDRVNVIGQVTDGGMPLLECVQRGEKFRLVRA